MNKNDLIIMGGVFKLSDNVIEVSDKTISISDILTTLLKKKFVILMIFVLCFAVGLVYAFRFVKPKYVSSTKISVINPTESSKISSEVAVGNYIVTDVKQLVTDRTVLEEVGAELSPKLTYDQIKGYVSADVPTDSRIVEIKVSTPDPVLSKQICDKVCAVSKVKILNLFGVDKVNIFGPANLPSSNSAPATSKILLIALVAAIVLSLLYAVLHLFFNDMITSEEEIEKRLDLCVLASIPYSAARSKSRRKAGK